jgi:hypothetical protein
MTSNIASDGDASDRDCDFGDGFKRDGFRRILWPVLLQVVGGVRVSVTVHL